jgi:hypothetical protein
MRMAKPPVELKTPANAADILRHCSNLYLKLLGQLLQEAERFPADVAQTFLRGVEQHFDDIIADKRQRTFAQVTEIDASSISLLDEHVLDMEIRLGAFTSHLLNRSGAELWPVYLRFITLLNRPELTPSDNPVGPKGITQGLAALCRQLGENQEKTLERINHLEGYFADNLTVLYSALDEFLAERHVEAAPPSLITAPENNAGKSLMSTLNPAALLQSNLLGSGGHGMGQGGASAGGSGAAASLFSQAMFERLLSRLEELERQAPLAPLARGLPASANAEFEFMSAGGLTATEGGEAPAPRVLRSEALGIPGGAPEAATIDALALIFEAIFASTSLPDVIKSALSSLQIPTLKAAMLDPTFFTVDSHPARQLLDKMALAAIGLPRDVAPNHPVCLSIQAIASRVRKEFVRDSQIFIDHVNRLDALISSRNRAADQLASAYFPLITDFERQLQATRRCQLALEPFLQQTIPAGIAEFLSEQWQAVLLNIWLSKGELDEAWKAHIKVVDDLLWSIQPKLDSDERKKMSSVLPEMLTLLDNGMRIIELNEDSRSRWLDMFFQLQSTALQGKSPAPAKDKASLDDNSEHLIAWSEIHTAELCLKTGRLYRARSAGADARIGDWLEFESAAHVRLCGRLCQISPDTETHLLINPDWNFAVALQAGVVAAQLRDKQAAIVSTASLFDTAAEKALRNAPKRDVLA